MIAAIPGIYPGQWAVDALLMDESPVHIRPIRPDDSGAHRAFFALLSNDAVYSRFFFPKRELSDAEETYFTTVDYHDRMAFAAFVGSTMVAVGRYDRLDDSAEAEVAFAVADDHQGRGLATMLLGHLATYAAANGISRLSADTLPNNWRMLKVLQASGFLRQCQSPSFGVVHLVSDIETTGECSRQIPFR